MNATSPVDHYATDPHQTEHGAVLLLQRMLDWSVDATSLTARLAGRAPNDLPQQQLLEIIQLRLLEAKALAARL